MKQPFISVVTPFYNTSKYLRQCIESVLAQTYGNFEYILVDNCSSDGGGEIAEEYGKRDTRIRVLHRSVLLPQVQNYNAALTEISDVSDYCKIVQADDFLFPDCLALMVKAFQQSESIGLVGAYDLKENVVRGSGFPFRSGAIAGKEVAQLCLRSAIFVFGSPSSVMYRASIVRNSCPFYPESRLHEDTEKCMEILRGWDFGFVYQVLAFLRSDSDSISGAVRNLKPNALDRYIVVQRYASEFLDEPEASELKKKTKREYYEDLAHAALRFRGKDFWRYHKRGLMQVGGLDVPYLLLATVRFASRTVVNPGNLTRRLARYLRRKTDAGTGPGSDGLSQVGKPVS
jgi:glycosyltransferase involved in cell wall biosynthesis